ncbi:hypothetical protein O0L34_g2844 [Tuta absoluta]|nr:hypothetical protein O0L34_g2844 [Tuta absoluta]
MEWYRYQTSRHAYLCTQSSSDVDVASAQLERLSIVHHHGRHTARGRRSPAHWTALPASASIPSRIPPITLPRRTHHASIEYPMSQVIFILIGYFGSTDDLEYDDYGHF